MDPHGTKAVTLTAKRVIAIVSLHKLITATRRNNSKGEGQVRRKPSEHTRFYSYEILEKGMIFEQKLSMFLLQVP